MSSDTVYRRLAAEEINACQSYMRYAEKRLLEEGALAEVATRQLKRTNRYFWFYLFWVVLFSLNAVTGSAMYEGRSELVDVVYRSASLIGALIFAYIGSRRYWVTSLHMRRALSFLERANTTTAEKPTAPEM